MHNLKVISNAIRLLPGGYIDVGELPLFQFGRGTLEVWVLIKEDSGYQVIAAQVPASGQSPRTLLALANGVPGAIFDSGSPYLTAKEKLEPGQWHHISLVARGNLISLFVNGVHIDTRAQMGVFLPANLIFGSIKDPQGLHTEMTFQGYFARMRCSYQPIVPTEQWNGVASKNIMAEFDFTNTPTLNSQVNVPYQGSGILTPRAMQVEKGISVNLYGGVALTSGMSQVDLGSQSGLRFNIGKPHTIESWFLPLTAGVGNVIGKGDDLLLSLKPPATGTFFQKPDSTPIVNLQANKWNHIAVTYGARQVRSIFQNGEMVGAGTATIAYSSPGSNWFLGGNGFNGVIRTLRVWDEALPPNDIKRSMNNIISPNDARLVAEADFASYGMRFPDATVSSFPQKVNVIGSGFERERPYLEAVAAAKNPTIELWPPEPWSSSSFEPIVKDKIHAASAGITSRSALVDHFELENNALKEPEPRYRVILSLPPIVKTVLISSDQAVTVRTTKRSYVLNSGLWTRITPNALSKLMLTIESDGLSVPPLFVRTDEMLGGKHLIVYPDHETHRRIAELTPGNLYQARTLLKLNPNLTENHINHVQRAMQDLTKLVKYTYNPSDHGVHHGRGVVPQGMSSTHWSLDIANNQAIYQTLNAAQVTQVNTGATRIDSSRARSVSELEGRLKAALLSFTKIVVHTEKRVGKIIVEELEQDVKTVQQVGEDLVHGDVAGSAKNLWSGHEQLGVPLVKGGEYIGSKIIGFAEHAAVVTLHTAQGAVQFTLDHTGVVGSVINNLLTKVGTEGLTVLTSALHWLKDKLHWSDAVRTQQYLVQKFDHSLVVAQQKIVDIKNDANKKFSRLEAEVISLTATALRDINIKEPAHSSHHERHSSHMEKGEWLFSLFVESSGTEVVDPHPLSGNALGFYNAIGDKMSPGNLAETLGVKAFDKLKSLQPGSQGAEVASTVITVVSELIVEALKVFNSVEDAILNVESWLFGEIRSVVEQPIDSTLLNAIWNAQSGGSTKLRSVDLMALILALPLTAITMERFGAAPFTSSQRVRTEGGPILTGDPSLSTTLLPTDGEVRDWGIAYGLIHLVLGIANSAGRYREVTEDSNVIVDRVLATVSLIGGALAQVAGSPIGVPMDLNVAPPESAKTDIYGAPNYWANWVWMFQWINYSFDAIGTLGGLTSKQSIPFVEGIDVVMFLMGIPHCALMGVLDQADRAKMQALNEVSTAGWNLDDLDLFIVLQGHKDVSPEYVTVRNAWKDAAKIEWVQKIRNYDTWARNGAPPGIPEKGFGNIADTLPEIGSLAYFAPILEGTGKYSAIFGMILDVLGHFGEAGTYLIRAGNDRLL